VGPSLAPGSKKGTPHVWAPGSRAPVAVPVSKKRAHVLQEGQEQTSHGRDIRGLTGETLKKKSYSRKF